MVIAVRVPATTGPVQAERLSAQPTASEASL
jgi:hypothetical protein